MYSSVLEMGSRCLILSQGMIPPSCIFCSWWFSREVNSNPGLAARLKILLSTSFTARSQALFWFPECRLFVILFAS